MINVSQAVKQACNSPQSRHKEFIIIDGTTIVVKAKLSATAFKKTTFIGTFNMKVLEFETENTINFKKKEFDYYKQVNEEIFKIGRFIVTDVKDNDTKEIVKVTANDYALKFAVPYISNLDYASKKITLFNVLSEACNKAGVQLENTSITNGNFIVENNQFVNDELIGDVICAICGASLDFATITDNNKLKLLFTNPTDEIIEDYVELLDKRDTHPFTSVVLGNEDIEGQEAIRRDQELINKYGEKYLTINDNPFAYTYEKREQLVDAIFNKVKGFSYSSFKSEYVYKPYLTLGDLIKFKNKKGDLVNSIVLKYEFDYENCVFEAPSITKSAVDYKREQTPYEIAKRVQIKVDQNKKEIEATVEELSKVNNDVSNNQNEIKELQTKVTQNSQSVNVSISELTEKVNTNSDNFKNSIDNINSTLENGVEKLKNTLVKIDINGITVSTNLSTISTIMTNKEFAIKTNTGQVLAFFGYDEKEGKTIAQMDNLTITNYFIAGYHRVEKMPNKRTGWFYVGGNI